MGELPRAVALNARSKGYKVFAVALEPLADESLSLYVDEIKKINVGKLGEIIETLKEHDIKEVIMAGKVPKSLLYKNSVIPDFRAMKLLFFLKNRSDDSIMLAITSEFEKDGIRLLDITDFSSNMMATEGVMTKNKPTKEEWKDIYFGWPLAKEIGRLDIGQTVVIKNQAVMAVEAIEGTDEAIKRGGKLAAGGAVIIKVSKPQQDMRFDVPTVGLSTLRSLIEVNARILALEAEKCICLDKDDLIKEADKARVSILGYKHPA